MTRFTSFAAIWLHWVFMAQHIIKLDNVLTMNTNIDTNKNIISEYIYIYLENLTDTNTLNHYNIILCIFCRWTSLCVEFYKQFV